MARILSCVPRGAKVFGKAAEILSEFKRHSCRLHFPKDHFALGTSEVSFSTSTDMCSVTCARGAYYLTRLSIRLILFLTLGSVSHGKDSMSA